MKHYISLQAFPGLFPFEALKKFKFIGAASLAATISYAGEWGKPAASEVASDTVFRLGTVTVYGEKESAPEKVPARVDQARIELLEKRDLSSALALVPGVTITRFAGRNDASVFVRGFSRNQVPLFIDGVPVYVPYDGTIDMARFTAYDAAEISVAKGYSSVLLGANTMGGAINVVSRQPQSALEGRIGAGIFTGQGREGSINLGSRQKLGYVQLGSSYVDQDHYKVPKKFTPVVAEDGGSRENSYHTDWKFSAKAAFTPNPTDEYAVGFIHQEGEKGNPPVTNATPSFWRWPKWNKETYYFVSNTRLGEASYLKPRIYFDRYDNSLSIFDNASYTTQNSFNAAKNSGSGTSEYNDYSWGGSMEAGTQLIPKNSLKTIFQEKRDHHRERPDKIHRSGVSFVDEDRGWSAAVEDTINFSSLWDLQAGIDYDKRKTVRSVDSSTGAPFPKKEFSSVNPQVGVFYKLDADDAIHLTISRKSRFPTMKERYSYRMPDSRGNPQGRPNPALEAEYATHYELGYVGKLGAGFSTQVSVFYSRIQDTITSVVVVPAAGAVPAVSQFQNVGVSDKLGAEMGLEYSWGTQVKAGLTCGVLRQRTLTTLPSNTAPVEVTSVPGRSGTLYADVHIVEWLSAIPSLQYSSWFYSTSDGRGNNPTLGGFTLAAFKFVVRLPRGFTVDVGVENIFDKNFQLQAGYPEAGRSWYTNVRYTF